MVEMAMKKKSMLMNMKKNIISFTAMKALGFVNREFPKLEHFKCNMVETNTALNMGAMIYPE